MTDVPRRDPEDDAPDFDDEFDDQCNDGDFDDGFDDDFDGSESGDEGDRVVFTYDATVGPGDASTPGVLGRGVIEIIGMMPWSSNQTFLVNVVDGDDHLPAVYKPERGERPLWDFPVGLWKREAASYELSRSMGFDLIPPTIVRRDGPFGVGSVQAFVPARFEEHYFTVNDRPEFALQLRRMCAFDLVANSADRKGGHCLVDDQGHVWGIDNGLTFHAEFKVRTVCWDFAGEPIPDDIALALARLLDCGLSPELAELLDPFEREAVLRRTRALLSEGHFPHDSTGRRYPWPLV